MDSVLHSQIVELRNENFAPARKMLMANGLPIDEWENRGTPFDVSQFIAEIELALELPLWPFSQERIVSMLRNARGNGAVRGLLTKLIHKKWTDDILPNNLTQAERLARGRSALVLDCIATCLAYHLRSRLEDRQELSRLLSDKSLGPARVFFVPIIRRVFKEDPVPLLQVCLEDPELVVEAKHQLLGLDKAERKRAIEKPKSPISSFLKKLF